MATSVYDGLTIHSMCTALCVTVHATSYGAFDAYSNCRCVDVNVNTRVVRGAENASNGNCKQWKMQGKWITSAGYGNARKHD